jgi:hypothetical protein
MSSTKSKFRLIGAFAALLALALAVSCRGFFVNPTLTSISISPTAPQVALGQTTQLQLWGTYNDGSRGQVTKGVSWSSNPLSVVTIDSGGNMTGVALGTTTVSGTAQGLPAATASATVYLTGVTKITVNPGSWNFSSASGQSTPESFTAEATVNGQTSPLDITVSGAVWTITPTTTGITCTANTTAGTEDCTAQGAGAVPQGTYTLRASYPGTTIVGTATINVGQ